MRTNSSRGPEGNAYVVPLFTTSDQRRASAARDLKADLSGEMKRIAAFLGIETKATLWPQLVEAATFEKMKNEGAALLPGIEMAVRGGHQTFLDKGANGRWRDVLTKDDVARYRERAAAELSPGLNDWLEHGRRGGDPKTAKD